VLLATLRLPFPPGRTSPSSSAAHPQFFPPVIYTLSLPHPLRSSPVHMSQSRLALLASDCWWAPHSKGFLIALDSRESHLFLSLRALRHAVFPPPHTCIALSSIMLSPLREVTLPLHPRQHHRSFFHRLHRFRTGFIFYSRRGFVFHTQSDSPFLSSVHFFLWLFYPSPPPKRGPQLPTERVYKRIT